jgi:hypothetical protein
MPDVRGKIYTQRPVRSGCTEIRHISLLREMIRQVNGDALHATRHQSVYQLDNAGEILLRAHRFPRATR